MVFWHEFDMEHRPCLIVHLGIACLNLPSHDRAWFSQAVISRVEHGVLHLVDAENPHITVLVDCEGLSPLRIPMQLLRSCSSLLQNHFPNRLGCLLVIRLPPVVRAISLTFTQILKPGTQKKVKIIGVMLAKFSRVIFRLSRHTLVATALSLNVQRLAFMISDHIQMRQTEYSHMQMLVMMRICLHPISYIRMILTWILAVIRCSELL